MARPPKTGLAYFSIDVDIMSEDSVAFVEAKYGVQAFGILIRVLMRIYRKGYYLPWTETEQYLLARDVSVDINLLREVVSAYINSGFFHKGMVSKHKILTSHGIQKMYAMATVRRPKKVAIDPKYLLLSIGNEQFITDHLKTSEISADSTNETSVEALGDKGCQNNVNVDSNPPAAIVNADSNPPSSVVNVDISTKARARKESKVKESKEKESKVTIPDGIVCENPPLPFSEITASWNELTTDLPKVLTLPDRRKASIKARWGTTGSLELFRTTFKRVQASDFLTGKIASQDKDPFQASFDWVLNPNNWAKIVEGNYDNKGRRDNGSRPASMPGNESTGSIVRRGESVEAEREERGAK